MEKFNKIDGMVDVMQICYTGEIGKGGNGNRGETLAEITSKAAGRSIVTQKTLMEKI